MFSSVSQPRPTILIMWSSSSRKLNISNLSISKMHHTIETNKKPSWNSQHNGYTHKGSEKPMKSWMKLTSSYRLVQVPGGGKLQTILPKRVRIKSKL